MWLPGQKPLIPSINTKMPLALLPVTGARMTAFSSSYCWMRFQHSSLCSSQRRAPLAKKPRSVGLPRAYPLTYVNGAQQATDMHGLAGSVVE